MTSSRIITDLEYSFFKLNSLLYVKHGVKINDSFIISKKVVIKSFIITKIFIFFIITLKDRLMAGGSYLGSNSGSSQFYNHGFVDPFTISDVRDHFSDFSSRPTSRFVFL